MLFRRAVRSTDYGDQARLLTAYRTDDGHDWDWLNRIVYLPRGPVSEFHIRTAGGQTRGNGGL